MAQLFQEFIKFVIMQNGSVNNPPPVNGSELAQYLTADQLRSFQQRFPLDFGPLDISTNPPRLSAAGTADLIITPSRQNVNSHPPVQSSYASATSQILPVWPVPAPLVNPQPSEVLAHLTSTADPIFSGLPPFATLDMPPLLQSSLRPDHSSNTANPTHTTLPPFASLDVPLRESSRLPYSSARGLDPTSTILPPLASLDVLPQFSQLPRPFDAHNPSAHVTQRPGIHQLGTAPTVPLFLPEPAVDEDGDDEDSESVTSLMYPIVILADTAMLSYRIYRLAPRAVGTNRHILAML